jgi:DNA polymerase-3 subunit alpha
MTRFHIDRDERGAWGIRFGLAAIKSVSEAAIDSIIAMRDRDGAFKDVPDFIRRVGDDEALNKRTVENLIRAGAFDKLDLDRPRLLLSFERAMDDAARRRKQASQGQMSLFGTDFIPDDDLYAAPSACDVPRQTLLTMEKQVTGVYISGHPLEPFRSFLEGLECGSQLLSELADQPDGGLNYDRVMVTMGGMVTAVRTKVTKNNALMAFVTLEDLTGETECLLFPKVYDQLRSLIEEDSAIVFTGELSINEEDAPKLLVRGGGALKDVVSGETTLAFRNGMRSSPANGERSSNEKPAVVSVAEREPESRSRSSVKEQGFASTVNSSVSEKSNAPSKISKRRSQAGRGRTLGVPPPT